MAAFFFDIDGTIFKFGTNKPLDGAVDLLKNLKRQGHQIVITTKRGYKTFPKDHPVYNTDITIKALKDLGIEYDAILFGIESPRVIINDDGADGIDCETDGDITEIKKKINKSLERFYG